MTCSEGCGRDATRGDGRCGRCARALDQQRGNPRAVVVSARDNLREAANAYADACAEDNAAWVKLDDNLRKAAKSYASQLRSEAIRRGLAEARRSGVQLGRPRTLQRQQVAELAERLGIRGAARAMRVSLTTLHRCLSRKL